MRRLARAALDELVPGGPLEPLKSVDDVRTHTAATSALHPPSISMHGLPLGTYAARWQRQSHSGTATAPAPTPRPHNPALPFCSTLIHPPPPPLSPPITCVELVALQFWTPCEQAEPFACMALSGRGRWAHCRPSGSRRLPLIACQVAAAHYSIPTRPVARAATSRRTGSHHVALQPAAGPGSPHHGCDTSPDRVWNLP